MGENAEDLDAFREEWMADLAPEGPREEYQANRAVEYAWRLRRIPRLEQRYLYLLYYHHHRATVPPEELAQCSAESRLRFWDEVSAGILADRKFYPNLIRCEGHLDADSTRPCTNWTGSRRRGRMTEGRKRREMTNAECRMPNQGRMTNAR